MEDIMHEQNNDSRYPIVNYENPSDRHSYTDYVNAILLIQRYYNSDDTFAVFDTIENGIGPIEYTIDEIECTLTDSESCSFGYDFRSVRNNCTFTIFCKDVPIQMIENSRDVRDALETVRVDLQYLIYDFTRRNERFNNINTERLYSHMNFAYRINRSNNGEYMMDVLMTCPAIRTTVNEIINYISILNNINVNGFHNRIRMYTTRVVQEYYNALMPVPYMIYDPRRYPLIPYIDYKEDNGYRNGLMLTRAMNKVLLNGLVYEFDYNANNYEKYCLRSSVVESQRTIVDMFQEIMRQVNDSETPNTTRGVITIGDADGNTRTIPW